MLKKTITAVSKSDLAQAFKKLDNIDWVKHGLELYLQKDKQHCPFCQQQITKQYS
ncbi:hypothetical protein FAI40_02760 [Acetobacteraceae bacterium]|nr:hypothetical protein FAI40_02760 [Acetobacteraceae bacterium]